jgi:hypothetical protein
MSRCLSELCQHTWLQAPLNPEDTTVTKVPQTPKSSAPHRQPKIASVRLSADGLHAAKGDGLRQAVRLCSRHVAQPVTMQRLHRDGVGVVRVARLPHQHHGMPCSNKMAFHGMLCRT